MGDFHAIPTSNSIGLLLEADHITTGFGVTW
jgi:hypothetical protein